MVDLSGTHGAITSGDFIFKVGNNQLPDGPTAPAPLPPCSSRDGQGVGVRRIEPHLGRRRHHHAWLE